MIRARIQDALDIWHRDETRFPQSSPVTGFIGFLLRIKCSICILLGREGTGYDYVPVYVGTMFVCGYDASWTEVGVKWGWRDWQYSRYQDGI